MSRLHIALALSLALIAFAANSILCRVALGGSDIEPGLFTTIRIFSGAILLVLIARREALRFNVRSWLPAVMLFVYAAGFSYAYVELSAGTGALLLFGSVQLTMLLGSLIGGERFGVRSIAGWVFACAGLALLLLPGAEMAPVRSAALMITAGVAWGIYSLLGKRIADPAPATARNFLLASVMVVALFLVTNKVEAAPTDRGIALAVISGAVTSGLGYVIWYQAIRHISSMTAAVAQLTVPVIAATGGVLFLSEVIDLQFAIATVLTLGGVALAISGNLSRRKLT